MATMNYNTQEGRAIIRDLGEKYPKGPRGRITKLYYRGKFEWVDVYRRSTTVHRVAEGTPERICPAELIKFFGWDPVAVFRMSITSEEDAIRAAIDVRGVRESLTAARRRGRLAWTRIREANKHVKQNGTAGLWRVTFKEAPWTAHILYSGLVFYGTSKADVEARIAVIAPMLGAAEHWKPNVEFHDLGTPADAAAANTAVISLPTSRAQREIEDLERRLAKARAELEAAKQTMGRVMGAVMMDMDDGDPEDGSTTEAA
jgi:hypothetical protein